MDLTKLDILIINILFTFPFDFVYLYLKLIKVELRYLKFHKLFK